MFVWFKHTPHWRIWWFLTRTRECTLAFSGINDSQHQQFRAYRCHIPQYGVHRGRVIPKHRYFESWIESWVDSWWYLLYWLQSKSLIQAKDVTLTNGKVSALALDFMGRIRKLFHRFCQYSLFCFLELSSDKSAEEDDWNIDNFFSKSLALHDEVM